MSGLPRRRALGLLAGGTAALLAAPARADTALDVAVLQTASSLEALAEAAWGAVGAAVGPDALATVAAGAGRWHGEQKRAFQGRTAALGGRTQDAPNPAFASLLAGADPVAAVTTAEQVLVGTYLANLGVLGDSLARELVAGAMAMAAQHLALLQVGGTGPLRLPLPASALAAVPAAAGTAAPAAGLHQVGPGLVADPSSGVPS